MKRPLERLAIAMMLAGIVFLCQPLLFVLYQWGFQITLAGTVLFIVVSHMK
jgi:hypothetical protein